MVTVDFNKLIIEPGDKILDIGCGSGRHTCAAYQLPQVISIGADLNYAELNEAKGRLNFHDSLGAHGGGSWGLSVANILCLPFHDNFFDLVICSEVIEHVKDHRRAVREVIRILKPHKNLVVSVPRYWPERICWTLSKEYRHAKGGHVRIYKSRHLVPFLESFGLKSWALHHAHGLHTPYWWLKCMVGPSDEQSAVVNLYHRFLTWDIMQQPRLTRFMDRLLNPLIGKSVVVYLRKI